MTSQHHNYRIYSKIQPGQAEDYEIELRDGAQSVYGFNEEPDSQFIRMRRMWRHALIERVRSAEGRIRGNAMSPGGRYHEMRQCQAFFDDAGPDFRLHCEMAGFHPDWVHRAWKEGRLCADALNTNHRAMK